MIYIQYPSGSHGNFLKLLINELASAKVIDDADSNTYDKFIYGDDCFCLAEHIIDSDISSCNIVNIIVEPKSYLKYFTMCVSRTARLNIDIDELTQDTFNKIKLHPILSHFTKSLSEISSKTTGNVEPKFIREWFRLCFFDNNGETITKFIQPNHRQDARFNINFESFYDGSILSKATEVCNAFGIPVLPNETIYQRLVDFKTNNKYYDTDKNVNQIIGAIDNGTDLYFKTNLLEQACINNHLSTLYNVEPLLENTYFSNTSQIRNIYKL